MEYDMNKDLLPIGTIVKVRFAKPEFMIFGYYIKNKNGSKVYDYCALTYPWGLMNLNNMAGFDRDVIKKVVHLGYINEEQKKFIEDLRREKEQQSKSNSFEFIEL